MKKPIFIIFIVLVILVSLLPLFYFRDFFIYKKLIINNEPIQSFDLSFLEKNKRPSFLNFFEDVKEEFISNKTDFLEANLAEMKIRIYKEGFLEKEFPILTKGDLKTWGGSPVGLYKIMSGGISTFSITSQVYMPYALRYYGKYYFHGEPYYPWGEELISQFSGGCLRLKNEDAKEIYELTEIDMPVLVIDKERDDYEYLKEEIYDFPEIFSQSYLIADLDSGYIFAEKNYQKQLPIASLTKLMTATVISENVDFEKSILTKDYMLNAYGSTEGLETGRRFKAVELFYPLLIESSNDAAEVLSYFLGKDNTLGLMNEKSKAILMSQTEFVDPSGYDSGNVSTAKDLFYLIRYIFNNRLPILKITKGERVASSEGVVFDIKDLWNKNVFIADSTLIGGKTGFIEESKNTAVFIFRFLTLENQERNIVFILLKSANTKTDTQRMYRWLQRSYFLSPVG